MDLFILKMHMDLRLMTIDCLKKNIVIQTQKRTLCSNLVQSVNNQIIQPVFPP